MNHLIMGDRFLRMIETDSLKGVQDVLVTDFCGVIMDEETSGRCVEFCGPDAVSHGHQGLLYIVMDGFILEQ